MLMPAFNAANFVMPSGASSDPFTRTVAGLLEPVLPRRTTAPGSRDRNDGAGGGSQLESCPVEPRRAVDRRNVGHGMLNAGQVASRFTVACRHVVIKLLGKLPGTRFKSTLIRRLLGVRMGANVGFAYGSFIDPYAPSMISFGDNVIVGFEAKVFVHMFTLSRQRVRPVTIGSNVLIGACSIIAPGVTIGDGATIAPGTLVTRDVPPGALAMGNPMQLKRRGDARPE
jgi:acetyltransferase-like isoleucine patch superfamily enzyme